jgi:hypothetical protein
MAISHERKASIIGAVGACLLKALMVTLRFRVEDRAGVAGRGDVPPVIWAFWHNRILVVPHMFSRYFRPRRGAALTSASKDGELLAQFIKRFGILPVRGSSSRRGAAALLEMVALMESGCDIGITPDGPRGPRYSLNSGIVKLAQTTGAAIVPLGVEYSRCIRLKSWDAFMIPLPFSRVNITLGEPIRVAKTSTDDEFEAERQRVEIILQPAGAR